MSLTSRIRPLPLQLANQIAAGEVVERPASVVKELVENSIDAGATQIDIVIEAAGSSLISIRDNGGGIHRDDLVLALSRHATSKLHTSDELSHIDSLGFRGEALPSIASVSRLTLTSRQHENECGWQTKGELDEVVPAAHDYGTTVEVRDLFYNVPARRRFLRSNKTEQHHILTTLYRQALSRFDIGFNCQFSSNNRLRLPEANTLQQQQLRVGKICGKAFIENALHIEQIFEQISLSGWIVKSSAHRAQTDVQYFFINGRVIRDRVIAHAVRQAYADSIPDGRQPAYVLYLTLPLDRVDVNVHPTKHEVRFRDARLIHNLITRAVSEALQAQDNLLELDTTVSRPNRPQRVAESSAHYHPPVTNKNGASPTSVIHTNHSPSWSLTKNSSILHQRYVIVQDEYGPVLIDLQQAERSIRRRQLEQAIANNNLLSRPILVPVKMHVDADIINIVQDNNAVLTQLGFQFECDSASLTVRAIPTLLAQADIKTLVTAVIEALQQQQHAVVAISQVLQDQLPWIAITGEQQANSILHQLGSHNRNASPWCIELDSAMLSSLFSA